MTGTPVYSINSSLKLWVLPYKLVWNWRGLPWKFVEILGVVIFWSPISSAGDVFLYQCPACQIGRKRYRLFEIFVVLQNNVCFAKQCLFCKTMSVLQNIVCFAKQCLFCKTMSVLQNNVCFAKQCLFCKTLCYLPDLFLSQCLFVWSLFKSISHLSDLSVSQCLKRLVSYVWIYTYMYVYIIRMYIYIYIYVCTYM